MALKRLISSSAVIYVLLAFLITLLWIIFNNSKKSVNFAIDINNPQSADLRKLEQTTKEIPSEYLQTKPNLVTENAKSLKTEPLKPIESERLSSKWVVVTSIQPPTEDIKLLGALSKYGWRILVVGDKSSPPNWSEPEGVRFLSHKEAMTLGYNLLMYQHWKTYSVKNIGYLFAIQHGAEIIYDTDDDNHPTDKLLSFLQLAGLDQNSQNKSHPSKNGNKEIRALVMNPSPDDYQLPVLNTLPHFGQSSLWPRGFPLTEISRPAPRTYKLCSTQAPSWIQGVVNGDPDMDAIFRLTRKHFNTPINLTFDRSPPIVAPEKFFVQSNSQNTFFTNNALPLMLFPSGPKISFRETDIWRGYIGQPMLWLAGARKGYIAPNAFQARNAHDYLKDFDDEINLYKSAGKLISTLQSWECPVGLDFGGCFINIYEYLASKDLMIMPIDVETAKAWISDLRRMSFKFPERKSTNNCNEHEEKRFVQYFPYEQPLPLPAHPLLSRRLINSPRKHISFKPNSCQFSNSPPEIESSKIALIIFASSQTNLQPTLERLDVIYRSFVKRRIFCLDSESITKADILKFAKDSKMTIVESQGVTNVECMVDCIRQVASMRLESLGFAFISVTTNEFSLLTPEGFQQAIDLEFEASSSGKLIGGCDKHSVPTVLAIGQNAARNVTMRQLNRLCMKKSQNKTKLVLPTKQCGDWS